jgi:2,3-bisphosphoglycerate-dependent phosphoglycerate mutase
VALVRHAEPLVPMAGGPDDFHRGLTERGCAQAQRLVAELVQLRPVMVMSSPFLRAVQTVMPTARRLGMAVVTDPALREWDSGLAPCPDFADHYAISWADPGFVRPGGESLAQLSERAVRALRALADEFDRGAVVVGSHGTFISRALTGFGVTVDWPFSRTMPMPAIYRLRIADHQVTVTGPGL